MKLVLIGEEQSKRTAYMKKAAERVGVELQLLRWMDLENGFDVCRLKGEAVKIDPPSYGTVYLHEMQRQLAAYEQALQKLAQAECRFLNSPDAVRRMLNKRETKRRLKEQGIPVTQMFAEMVSDLEQLLELMHRGRCYSVFVKPEYFSGAAGVAAFRIQPGRGKMTLYTSCRLEGQQLANTKKMHRLESREEICRLLNQLLALGCVVERWHPKADFCGKSYDLRAVCQFGHIAHIVVRQSNGPVTNLHLNNQALEIQALGLDGETMQEIEAVCRQAVSLFAGLQMAGIDVLLEKGTLRPRIIEMNGQGDLIYQDIYGDNRIYCEQAAQMLSCLDNL